MTSLAVLHCKTCQYFRSFFFDRYKIYVVECSIVLEVEKILHNEREFIIIAMSLTSKYISCYVDDSKAVKPMLRHLLSVMS